MSTNSAGDTLVFDFNAETDPRTWSVQDDVVMGGRSEGRFTISDEGHGLFYGEVSVENNGGFSSVRYREETFDIQPHQKIQIRLKGDGNRYQFRVKRSLNDRVSYISYFDSSGEWKTITLQLNTLYPTFRGRNLDMPDFDHNQIQEIAFLIGNKKEQKYRLEIDYIRLIND